MVDWGEVRNLDLLRKTGHPAEALDRLRSIRIMCTDNEARASILLNESVCYCDLGQFTAAVEAALTALRLLPPGSPSHPFAEFSLACAHQLNGELELSAQELRTFLQEHQELLDTGDYSGIKRDALHRLAAILISLGHSTEPLFLLEILKTEAENPRERAELQYREAEANRLLSRHDRAFDLFQQALAGPLDSQFVARAHFGMGEILYNQRKFTDALAEFEDALRLTRSDSPDYQAFTNWLHATRRELKKGPREPVV